MQEGQKIDKGTIIADLLGSKGYDEVNSPDSLAANLDDLLRIPTLTSKELAIALYHSTKGALNGRYGENPEPALDVIKSHVQTWTDCALRKKEYTGYTIAHMLDGFAHLNLRPPERFVSFALEKAKNLISGFNADDIVFFSHAVAHLGILPDKKLLIAMGDRIRSSRSYFSPHQLHSLIRSLAVLDCLSVHHHVSKRYSFGSLFSELLNDRSIRAKIASVTDADCKAMLSDAILWFKGSTPYARPSESDTSSLFESGVAAELRNLGASVTGGVSIQTPNHIVDLSATFGQATFFVECDGPTHFVHGADDHKVYLNGSTIFQTALIQKGNADKSLVRIPIDVYYPKQENRDFWDSFLAAVHDAEVGAYCLASNGKLLPVCDGYAPPAGYA